MKKMNATLAISLALLSASAVAADEVIKAPESLIYEVEPSVLPARYGLARMAIGQLVLASKKIAATALSQLR